MSYPVQAGAGTRNRQMSSSEKFSGGDVERHKGPVLVLPPPEKIPRWQVWRARLYLVEFVFVCLAIGIILVLTPWTSLWTNNSLLFGFPRLREFLMQYFVRGAVSGLGLVDIWLAIAEARRYREYFG